MTLLGPDEGQPELSAVIVTYGAWSLTEQAINALTEETECPFELIVVDNDSKDQTRARLSALGRARVILNSRNEGFGPAANLGAAHARAEHLLLLNTDAFVRPGWLEPMRETLRDPSVGAVIPCYLHPDGSLQDAGALLAQDGTVFVYGDGEDSELPSYRFRRVVDSGAAACMLMRRAVFEALGGFDPMYAPAYYDDADLCMRIAEHGLTVVYEPRSTVTHIRYGSADIDTAAELSEHNREQAIITARDAPATPRLLLAAAADEHAGGELASALLAAWPRSRITWATASTSENGFNPDRWLRCGVEVLPGSAWLERRLFHYDAVILGEHVSESLLGALRRTQPQAPEIAIGGLDGPGELLPRLVSAVAAAGVAPP
jgi:GT2 family glycosyltransferase